MDYAPIMGNKPKRVSIKGARERRMAGERLAWYVQKALSTMGREFTAAIYPDQAVEYVSGEAFYLIDHAWNSRQRGQDLEAVAKQIAEDVYGRKAVVMGRRCIGGFDCSECSVSNRLKLEADMHRAETGHQLKWVAAAEHGYTPGEQRLFAMLVEMTSYGRSIGGDAPQRFLNNALAGHLAWMKDSMDNEGLRRGSSLGQGLGL